MTKTLDIFMDPNVPDEYFPEYQTTGAAGFDIAAWIPTHGGQMLIPRGKSKIITTGLYFMIPEGYEVQIRSRSGLAFKEAIFVLNSPGTIDCDYRGEIQVVLQNAGPLDYLVGNGHRIAQAVFKKARQANLRRVTSLRHDTDRGGKGLGSTGK